MAGTKIAGPGPKVGKYTVDTKAVDSVAVPSVDDAANAGYVIIIDEVGRMELFSKKFAESVGKALETRRVMGTIMQKHDPYADAVKTRKDTKIVEVTWENRDAVPEQVVSMI